MSEVPALRCPEEVQPWQQKMRIAMHEFGACANGKSSHQASVGFLGCSLARSLRQLPLVAHAYALMAGVQNLQILGALDSSVLGHMKYTSDLTVRDRTKRDCTFPSLDGASHLAINESLTAHNLGPWHSSFLWSHWLRPGQCHDEAAENASAIRAI